MRDLCPDGDDPRRCRRAIQQPPRLERAIYTEVLGLRLVKTTVNFDDPGTFHLYYGDDVDDVDPGRQIPSRPGARCSAGAGQRQLESREAKDVPTVTVLPFTVSCHGQPL